MSICGTSVEESQGDEGRKAANAEDVSVHVPGSAAADSGGASDVLTSDFVF